MIRMRHSPLILAIFALSACGGGATDSGNVETGSRADPVEGKAAPAGTTWAQTIAKTDQGVRMGNPDAPLKLIEYGSYTCPHCRDFQAEAHEEIEQDYVNSGKVSFEYRSMIRDPIDLTVAMIAQCAPTEAFFALNSQLFANQDAMIEKFMAAPESARAAAGEAAPERRFVMIAELAGLIDFAKSRGLPEAQVRSCLADRQLAERIANVSDAALKEHPDFPGTPSFLINGTLLDNTASWDKLKPRLTDAGA